MVHGLLSELVPQSHPSPPSEDSSSGTESRLAPWLSAAGDLLPTTKAWAKRRLAHLLYLTHIPPTHILSGLPHNTRATGSAHYDHHIRSTPTTTRRRNDVVIMNGAPTPLAVAPAANGSRPSMATSSATSSAPPNPPVNSNGQPLRRKKRKPVDALRPVYRPLKTITKPRVGLAQMNEQIRKESAAGPAEDKDCRSIDQLRNEFAQFAGPNLVSLPLVVTKKDLKDLRHHIMRLSAKPKEKLDIQDKKQFTPPIRLHRRDPRAPPSGAGSHFDDEDSKEDLEEIKERERLEIVKEERRRVREENLSKVAPTGTKKPPAFQKKTEQKFRPDDTPEAQKRGQVRYEEALPWHLEDFENKQTWVGGYEAELSEAHVMLSTAYDRNTNIIEMLPIERWYKFQLKNNAQVRTADDMDEAVKKMNNSLPGFLSNIEEKSIKRARDAAAPRTQMMTRKGGNGDDEGSSRRRRGDDDPYIKREADADDIDFNMEEDFADDEEGLNGLFEGEEADVKDAQERLKRDQIGAAAFELRNEDEIYRQEERDRQEAENNKRLEKGLLKALHKREKNPDVNYGSDEGNPYLSETSDSDTDSETERQRTKEEEERKAAEQNGKPVEGDKPASGASTKGTNTPSGVHKPVDINKKKRPGSPNLSEASGNESSRKKHKKKHHDKLTDGTRKSHLNDVSKRGAGSGSESEMTDAGKSKANKVKVRLGTSPKGSPGSSRAGSPTAPQLNGSRAGSPAASGSGAAPVRKFFLEAILIRALLTMTLQKKAFRQQPRFTKPFLLKA
jgi:transcription initiation factor TFIIF subunit alpha